MRFKIHIFGLMLLAFLFNNCDQSFKGASALEVGSSAVPTPAPSPSPTPSPTATSVAVDGVCGTANNSVLAQAPTTNLCAKGTASEVSGAGPWIWGCAGQNGGLTANCTASSALFKSPAWYSSIPSGTWIALPNSALSTSQVLGGPNNKMESGFDGALRAWGGGVLNTNGITYGSTFIPGSFLCVGGGGHTDPNLNGLYCYGPLESDAPAWYLPRKSTSPGVVNMATDSSGNPTSCHRYDGVTYVPDLNSWFQSGLQFIATDVDSPGNTMSYRFGIQSPDTNQPWTQHAKAPGAAFLSAYDPIKKAVWAVFTYNLGRYDVALDKWDVNSSGQFTYNYNNAMSAFDSKRGILLLWNGQNKDAPTFKTIMYNTNSVLQGTPWVPKISGAEPTASGSYGGSGSVLYDSINDRFVVWFNSGRSLWTLTPPTGDPYNTAAVWTWSKLSPNTGATPSDELGVEIQGNNGTFGRFNFVSNPGVTGYVLMNETSQSVWFYRP